MIPIVPIIRMVSPLLLAVIILLIVFRCGKWRAGKINASLRPQKKHFHELIEPGLIACFMILFITLNIFPFRFVQYNETDTKFDYGFYLRSIGQPELAGGTTFGGLDFVMSAVYNIFGIDNFFESLILNKILMCIIFVSSFFLIRRIVSFFIRPLEGKWKAIAATLLTMLFFSLPQICIFYWNQKLFMMLADLFFLLAFSFLLDYLEKGKVSDFLLYLSSMLLSFFARPEFIILALFLFFFHLSSRAGRLLAGKLKKRQASAILINLAAIIIIIIIALSFLSYYNSSSSEDLTYFGTSHEIFSQNLRDFSLILAASIDFTILYAIMAAVLASLVFFSLRRAEALSALVFAALFLFLLLCSIWPYDGQMYLFYIFPLLFVQLAHLIGWLLFLLPRQERYFLLFFLALAVILSTLFIISPAASPLSGTEGSALPQYNRIAEMNAADSALETYLTLESSDAVIFEKWAGQLYLAYLFKDTNVSVVDLSELARLNTTYANNIRPKLVLIPSHSFVNCSRQGLMDYIESAYLDINSRVGLSALPYSEDLVQNLNSSNVLYYSSFGRDHLCEIIPE